MAIETDFCLVGDQDPDPGAEERTGPACLPKLGYEIRIRDHLDEHWYAWFDGWTISNLDDGEVLLRGLNVDQSALHGALNKIRDLNLTLISLQSLEKK